jgi:hypothetical protein
MEIRPRFAEPTAKIEEPATPNSVAEQTYTSYIRYFEQGIADPYSPASLECILCSPGDVENSDLRILDGLSASSKASVLRLFLQQNDIKGLRFSGHVDESSTSSHVPFSPSKGDPSTNESDSQEILLQRKQTVIEKWSESQKLASIFMPYGMSSFPEYGTTSSDATPLEITTVPTATGLDMSESSKHSAAPEESQPSVIVDATKEANDIAPQQLFNSTSVATFKSKMLKSVDIAKNVSGAVIDKLSEGGGGEKRKKWSFWGSEKVPLLPYFINNNLSVSCYVFL